jgi:hypothetical protein
VEDAKYHVFWSDVEELVDSPQRGSKNEEEVDDEEPSENGG